ncbi:hypothetical protein GLOTRDRAFT_11662, partial [Gloeophyllum trabeum ATCC 11539]
SLTATLGYGPTKTLLLGAPPWAVGAALSLRNARHANKTGERFWHLTVWWWIAILWYIVGLSTMHTGARYVFLHLLAVGYAG